MKNFYSPSATEAARLIRDGIISSEQLIEAYLARICEINPRVQARAFLDRNTRWLAAKMAES